MTFSPGCCCFVPSDVPKPDPCGVQVYGCFPGWPDKEPPEAINCNLSLPQFSLQFEHPCGGGVMTSPGGVDITLTGGATGYGTTGYGQFGDGDCLPQPLHFGADNDGNTTAGGNYSWETSHVNSSWEYGGEQVYESEEINWTLYRTCHDSTNDICPPGCSPGGFCGGEITGKLVTTVKVTLMCQTTTEVWGDPGNPLNGVPFLRPGTSGGPNDPPVQDWVFPDDFVQCRGICRDSDGTGDNYYGCFPGNPVLSSPVGFDVSIENTLLNSWTCAYKYPNEHCYPQGCDPSDSPAYFDALTYTNASVQVCPTPNYPVWTRGFAETLPDAFGDTCTAASKPGPGGFPESWTHAYWYDDPNIPPKVATQGSDVSEMPCYTTIGRVEIACTFDGSYGVSFTVGTRKYETFWEGCPLESGEMFPSGAGDHQAQYDLKHRYSCQANEATWDGIDCGSMPYRLIDDWWNCHAVCNDQGNPDGPPPCDGTPDVFDSMGNPIDSCINTGTGAIWNEPATELFPGQFNINHPASPPYNFTVPGWARKGHAGPQLHGEWMTQQFFKLRYEQQGGWGHHFLLKDGPPPHEYWPAFPMECGVVQHKDEFFTWPYRRCVCVGCGVDGCFQTKTYAAPGTELATDLPCHGDGTCIDYTIGDCPCDDDPAPGDSCVNPGCCGGCCCFVWSHPWLAGTYGGTDGRVISGGPMQRDMGSGRWLLREPGLAESPTWSLG